MKKGIIVLMLILCMCIPVSADETESSTGYSEKDVTVLTDGKEAGELTVRFYDDTPNIPYLGISEYSEYLKHQPLKMEENKDGTFKLENGIGEEMLFDPDEGTITVADWNGFFDLPLPLEDEAKGWKDTATRFIRIRDVEFEKEAAPVTLDFARYGIRVYADENDIYLPVSTLSNIMTDIATNYVVYNGKNLYVQRISLDGSCPDGLYDTERIKAELQGQERPEDIVKQSYADLCFNIDNFFGHPGKAPLDEAVAESGLEQALLGLGIGRQYLTIGINGLVEAAEFMGLKITPNDDYLHFVQGILGLIEKYNRQYRTKDVMFNCEMIPAENVGVKHAKWDREDGYFVPRDCYNSYFYIVEDDSLTILDKFKLHGAPYIEHLTGGSALHMNLEEHLSKEQYLKLLQVAAKEGCNYFTFNIPNTVCNECGHIDKRYLKECPVCKSKNIDYMTRIIGYLKRVSNFSQHDRKRHRAASTLPHKQDAEIR